MQSWIVQLFDLCNFEPFEGINYVVKWNETEQNEINDQKVLWLRQEQRDTKQSAQYTTKPRNRGNRWNQERIFLKSWTSFESFHFEFVHFKYFCKETGFVDWAIRHTPYVHSFIHTLIRSWLWYNVHNTHAYLNILNLHISMIL